MFDIGWTEMLVVAVVAIVVVGPRDLPKMLKSAGAFVRQARKLAREFQGGVEDFIREAELDDVKNSIHHVSNFDPTSRPDFVEDPTGGDKSKPETKPAPKPEESEASETPAQPPVKPATDDGKGDGG